jgi:hypothetical protein
LDANTFFRADSPSPWQLDREGTEEQSLANGHRCDEIFLLWKECRGVHSAGTLKRDATLEGSRSKVALNSPALFQMPEQVLGATAPKLAAEFPVDGMIRGTGKKPFAVNAGGMARGLALRP